MKKEKLYALINFHNDKFFLSKLTNGQFSFPIYKNLSILKKKLKNIVFLNKYTADKWYVHLDKPTKEWITYQLSHLNKIYLYIYTEECLSSIEGEYFSVEDIYSLPLSPFIYPLLFGALSKQICLEKKYLEIYRTYSPYEKVANMNFLLWKENIQRALAINSYPAAMQILFLKNTPTTKLQEYHQQLNAIPEQDLIHTALQIVEATHALFQKLIKKYDFDYSSYIFYAIEKGNCSFEDILNFYEIKKDFNKILLHFKRTKNQDSYAKFVVYYAEHGSSLTNFETLLQLNIISSYDQEYYIITKIYYAAYLILQKEFKEAYTILYSCYTSINKSFLDSYLILYSYTYPLLSLLMRLCNQFNTTSKNDIQKEFFLFMNRPHKEMHSYLKKALEYLEKYPISINSIQEKIIHVLTNMDYASFQEIYNSIITYLPKEEYDKLSNLINSYLLHS